MEPVASQVEDSDTWNEEPTVVCSLRHNLRILKAQIRPRSKEGSYI